MIKKKNPQTTVEPYLIGFLCTIVRISNFEVICAFLSLSKCVNMLRIMGVRFPTVEEKGSASRNPKIECRL